MTSPRVFALLVACALASPACSRKGLAPAQQPTDEPDAAAPVRPDAASARDTSATTPDVVPTADAAAAFPSRVIGGSRLKVMYARTPDGEKYFLFTYFDTQLKIPCTFAVAQDGRTRCLPLPAPSFLSHFNDQSCSQPLLPADPACAGAFTLQTVSGRSTVFRVGPVIAPATAFAHYNEPIAPPDDGGVSGGSVVGGTGVACWANASLGGQKFFGLDAAVPPEMFVAAEDEHPIPEPGKRIVGWGRAAEDGSKERTRWYDAKLNQRCFIDTAKDGQLRCVPWQWMVYPTRYFADTACTQRLAATVMTAPPVPYFVRVNGTTTCPPRATYYRTEPRPDLTTAYSMTASGCSPVAPPPGTRFYSLGAEVPPTEFDLFTEKRLGTGRLQRRVLSNAEGTIDRLSNPFDTTFGDLCSFYRAEDGSLRCAPTAGGRDDLFSDANCLVGAGAPLRSLNCGPVTSPHVTVLGGPWCNPVARVFPLAASPAPVWQHDLDGACVPTAVTGYFPFGAAESPGALPGAEAIQE